jgi:hypothetical protein
LDTLVVTAQASVSKYLPRKYPLKWHIQNLAEALSVQLNAYVYGKTKQSAFTYEHPATWWDALKETLRVWSVKHRRDERLASWLIRVWVRRHPVRYTVITADASAYFPEIVPVDSPHYYVFSMPEHVRVLK